jgi:hypothetical protein
MAVANTIKLAQLATGELLSFVYSGFGVNSGTNLQHAFTEEFLSGVGVGGNLNVSGNFIVKQNATFASGLLSQAGIQVQGKISGQSIQIDNFSLSSGSFGTITIGSMNLTGVPIYDSGNVAVGLALASGSVFGIKQKINDPRFQFNASGNLEPATGNLGVTVVLLCVSTGT